ncbi:MAG TPA: HAD-IA family hydrolase [Steroidobacteraceae bacterium]|nr:HAD-IA family hydrolase [Steroidobacteraceae bacterium]
MTSATPLAAVLLDLDGTLLDTAPDMVRIANMLRAQEGLPQQPYAHLRSYVSHGSAAVLRAAFVGLEGVRLAALQNRFLELYREHLVVETRLFAGFEQVLTALEAHAIPWGVITNKPGWLTEPLLQALGLYQRAGCVLSGDSLPVRKPDPLPLLTAAQRIAVAPERCLYAGDALRDMQAARAANMVGLAARYGYIGPQENTAEWPVTAWIDSPLELLDWVGVPRPARPRCAGAGAGAGADS